MRLGFERMRRKGSHVFYLRPGGRTTMVPDHSGRYLVRPLIREILREIELTPSEFRKILDEI